MVRRGVVGKEKVVWKEVKKRCERRDGRNIVECMKICRNKMSKNKTYF